MQPRHRPRTLRLECTPEPRVPCSFCAGLAEPPCNESTHMPTHKLFVTGACHRYSMSKAKINITAPALFSPQAEALVRLTLVDVHWQYLGLQVVRLENELISIDVLPELGAKIYNFVHLSSDRNLLW